MIRAMSALMSLAGMAFALLAGGWSRMAGRRTTWNDRYESGMLLALATFLGIFAPLRAVSTVGKGGGVIPIGRAEALAWAILLVAMFCAWRAVSRCAPTNQDPMLGGTLLLIVLPLAAQLLALEHLGLL